MWKIRPTSNNMGYMGYILMCSRYKKRYTAACSAYAELYSYKYLRTSQKTKWLALLLLLLLLLLLEKTNLSCLKQASRTGYKVNKAIQENKQGIQLQII